EFTIDRPKCALWNVSVADVQNVIQTAVGGKACTQVIEGERAFDLTVRWPARLRNNEQAILNIPLEVTGHTVTPPRSSGLPATPLTGATTGVARTGTSTAAPALTGSAGGTTALNLGAVPRRRLGDLVIGRNAQGQLDAKGQFIRPGASTISREQGQ